MGSGTSTAVLPRPLRRWLAIGLLLAVSACGSTSKREEVAGSSGPVRTDAAGNVIPGGASATPRGSTGGARGVMGASGAAGGGPAATGGGSTGVGPAAGPARGVTATEIRIGYGTQKDADQAMKNFGLSAAFGDVEAQARAIVNDINAKGGTLGRKIVLVVHDERSASDLQNPDATATSQCNDWTQDRPVFAGINIVGGRNRASLFGCMAKARTPLLFSDLVPHSLHQLRTYAPYLYAPGVATMDRWAPTWVKRLDARGYFTPWNTTTGAKGVGPVKVGVPYEDSDEGRLYLKVMKTALASVGREADATFAFASSETDALRQIPQMLLQFKSSNVTHVLLPASAYLVTPVAENEGYRPRYGLTTIDALSSLLVTTSPKPQLRGSLGVGWLPVSDMDARHDPGPVSANQTRCKNAMEKAGLATSDRLTHTTQLIVCDLFLFLDAALEKAGAPSASALQKGAGALLESFPSALTFKERYGPARFDGAAAVRDIGFNDGCKCFVYLDKVNRPLPS